MRCNARLCDCPPQDGETLEYMLAWIQEEPLKGGILFIVSPCSPAPDIGISHLSLCKALFAAPFSHSRRRRLQTWLLVWD